MKPMILQDTQNSCYSRSEVQYPTYSLRDRSVPQSVFQILIHLRKKFQTGVQLTSCRFYS